MTVRTYRIVALEYTGDPPVPPLPDIKIEGEIGSVLVLRPATSWLIEAAIEAACEVRKVYDGEVMLVGPGLEVLRLEEVVE